MDGLIGKLTRMGKPVLITSQFPAGSTLVSAYGGHTAAVAAGGIFTGNMTSSAATVKFRWALARIDAEIEDGTVDEAERLSRLSYIMHSPYVGEVGSVNAQFTTNFDPRADWRHSQ